MDEARLFPDPFQQFAAWLEEAKGAGLREPTAMALATVGVTGTPSVRMVLLRGWDEEGFRFFTNYESQKGLDLEANPMASLLFYWDPLQRQVRIDGEVARMGGHESDAYFATRPRDSQLGSWASAQSRPLKDRETLLQAVEDAAQCFPDEVLRPPWWGGFRLVPVRFEFWIAGQHRLHDRFRYEPDEKGWTITRLAP